MGPKLSTEQRDQLVWAIRAEQMGPAEPPKNEKPVTLCVEQNEQWE